MPSISTSFAPGTAFATARPPDMRTSLSFVPWMTVVGTRSCSSAGVRLGDARTASSWRPAPAGLTPRS